MQLNIRDRKVVRAASRCMGSTTGIDRHAPVVQAPSFSSPRCRPITSSCAIGAKTWSILLTVDMLCKDVYSSNRYSHTMHDRHVLSTRIKSQHIVPPPTHTGSAEVGHPVIDVYERCPLGVFQATVCALSVERVC